MNRVSKVVIHLFCILVALWLIAPTLIIIPISFTDKQSLSFPPSGFSFHWYQGFFTNPAWISSLGNSLQIAAIVAVVATAIGTTAAIGLEKIKSRATGIVRAILLAPMIVPGVVLATGIYAVFLEQRLLGTYIGYVVAHSMLALPFVLITVGANLAVFDPRLETAAASLGAKRLTTFFTITMPLIMPGILSGMLFAFVTSLDEVVVALFITSPQLRTLPVQVFTSITKDADPTVAVVGTLIFLMTTVAIVAGLALGPKIKRVFQ